jgi:LPPG:FO 2-phospho-L-lactate transferase
VVSQEARENTGGLLALAGGVGGAKLAVGLARVLPPEALTVVVNTGDDEEFHGLHVSPDLDTVMYSLAGLANPETGWGLQGDSFRVLEALRRLNADSWFQLGDLDLATHIRRTEMLRQGLSLTEVTLRLCASLGVSHTVVPMTDDRVRTVVETDAEEMTFQEYFVKHRAQPPVRRLRFDGAERARPSPAFAEALTNASAVVFCPSNPFLSVAPILEVSGVRKSLAARQVPKVIVSPIIAGAAVKGPLAKLFHELVGVEASALAVARYYRAIGTHFVLDQQDAALESPVEDLGYNVTVAQTLMTSDEDKEQLARVVCHLVGKGTKE